MYIVVFFSSLRAAGARRAPAILESSPSRCLLRRRCVPRYKVASRSCSGVSIAVRERVYRQPAPEWKGERSPFRGIQLLSLSLSPRLRFRLLLLGFYKTARACVQLPLRVRLGYIAERCSMTNPGNSRKCTKSVQRWLI